MFAVIFPGMSLVDSVRAGLAALEPLDVRDQAAADLALLYAQAIDDAIAWSESYAAGEESARKRPEGWQDKQRDPLAELGPKLLTALTALGMTPGARKTATTPAAERPTNPLDELRKRRTERLAT